MGARKGDPFAEDYVSWCDRVLIECNANTLRPL